MWQRSRSRYADRTGGDLVVAREAVVASMREALVGTKTVHYGHMSEIELISDVETMKIWAEEDIVVLPDGAPFGRIDGHCH